VRWRTGDTLAGDGVVGKGKDQAAVLGGRQEKGEDFGEGEYQYLSLVGYVQVGQVNDGVRGFVMRVTRGAAVVALMGMVVGVYFAKVEVFMIRLPRRKFSIQPGAING